MRWLSFPAPAAVIVIALASFFDAAQAAPAPAVAVSPQYDTTHVLVAPADFDRFTDSLIATFGGSKSQQGVIEVTQHRVRPSLSSYSRLWVRYPYSVSRLPSLFRSERSARAIS